MGFLQLCSNLVQLSPVNLSRLSSSSAAFYFAKSWYSFQVRHMHGSNGFEQLVKPLNDHRGVITVSNYLLLTDEGISSYDLGVTEALFISSSVSFVTSGYPLHVWIYWHVCIDRLKFGSSGMMIEKTLTANGLTVPCQRAQNLKNAVGMAKCMAQNGLSLAVIHNCYICFLVWYELSGLQEWSVWERGREGGRREGWRERE